jgi:AcrR family transcriptional regulator
MAPVKEIPPRTYGGETGGERVARRRAALVEAAFALAAEEGWRALRIERICAGAGLNKRYFYESFKDLDALAAAVMRWLVDDVITVTLAATDPDAPQEEFIRTAISALVRNVTDDPRRARILFGATAAGEVESAHRTDAIHRIAATIAAEGRTMHEVSGPVVDLTAAMLVGGTSQAVLDWLDGSLGTSREEFIEELVALWKTIGDGMALRAQKRALTDRRVGAPRRP